MQQGRVQMDADWNEQIDITDYRDRLFTEDFLGDTVGPSMGAGFAIGVTADQQDLTIGLGRYYVNGLLVENSNSLYFTNQTDYPNATLPTQDGVYLAYLDVWQRSLSVADDADMAESALGGADTATRLYTVAQVKLMPVDSTGITNLTYNALFDANAAIDSPAYNNAQQWNAMANRLPSNMQAAQLLPDVTTMTSNVDTTYRIQIHEGGNVTQATYKTSIDNPLVQVIISAIDASNNIVTLATQPLDDQLAFAVGQWLELSTAVRDTAKMPGDMVQITAADNVVLTVSGEIGADVVEAANTPSGDAIARRWQQNAIGVTNSNKNPLEVGLAINFLGNAFENGNYWQITTDTVNHTINWPSSNGQFVALPPNSTTISQLTPSVNSPTLQNQLYRVEIHQGGNASTATFKWSRDNASVSSSISAISSNNITLSTLPQDGVNGFMVYQWLELTTPARELTGVPGDMVQITAVNGATLTVSGTIGADITVANSAIARRWDTAVTSSGSQAENSIIVGTDLALENGLSVTFVGSDFRMGDYWLIPARAALNSQGSHIDWPMDDNGNYLTQLPDGIQRNYAPLAIMQRSNGLWIFESDARTISIPLSELNIKVIGADSCAPADTIHVDCNGQVGISTDTPAAKLDVQTNASMDTQDALHVTANNGAAAVFTNASTTQATVAVHNNSGGTALNVNGVTATSSLVINQPADQSSQDMHSLQWSGASTCLNVPFFIRGTGYNHSTASFFTVGATSISTTLRGLTLTIVSKQDLSIISSVTYDTWLDSVQSDALAQALIEMTNKQIGVLFSFDAWNSSITSNLCKALVNRGLNKALTLAHDSTNADHYPYAAIFEGGSMPTYKAIEVLQNNNANAPFADVNGWLAKVDNQLYSFNGDDKTAFSTLENAAMRIIRGSVNGNITSASPPGTTIIKAGSGFTVQRLSTGIYKVFFNVPFSSRPSAAATQLHSAGVGHSPYDDMSGTHPGNTTDNAVIMGIDPTAIVILTGDSAEAGGHPSNRDFEFIVIGPA
jgi:hypothetical protein